MHTLMQVNFNTGSDANDFMHGWLNYQIEHHMFPDLSMLSYQVRLSGPYIMSLRPPSPLCGNDCSDDPPAALCLYFQPLAATPDP